MNTESRRRSSWRVWIIGTLALLVLYVASIGPVLRLAYECVERGYGSDETWTALGQVYAPVIWVLDRPPQPVSRAIGWYLEFCLTVGNDDSGFIIPRGEADPRALEFRPE